MGDLMRIGLVACFSQSADEAKVHTHSLWPLQSMNSGNSGHAGEVGMTHSREKMAIRSRISARPDIGEKVVHVIPSRVARKLIEHIAEI